MKKLLCIALTLTLLCSCFAACAQTLVEAGLEQYNAQNYEAAMELWLKAAEDGATAMNNLGVLYENGLGVTQDDAQAFEWYEKAAALGNAKAMANLGAMYSNGRGTAQDYAKAIEW